ncbi:DUF397 domain-containing protein [Streptomyces niveiscabiei]|uniref:DUF397 domain-containing protein n=1 Tax=Streptomyces niveiscabiei TaxID=164115 RepID=A0ABW9HV99_9ACTN
MSTELPHWFASSHSGKGGQCIEAAVNLAATHSTVSVRDSKRTSGLALDFRSRTFSLFVTDVKNKMSIA